MLLPSCFCWTRYGTEAGEPFSVILERKERERRANDGIFLWGIGNALGPSINLLLRKTTRPKVVFSPIRSAPRVCDVNPEQVVTWAEGETLRGDRYILPRHSVVKSRINAHGMKRPHYALVCFSSRALDQEGGRETLSFGQLCNLLSGRPLGVSQVTAIVSRNVKKSRGRIYPITMLADLCPPYYVRLRESVGQDTRIETR